MKKTLVTSFATLLFLVGMIGISSATPITIYNTGVDGAGSLTSLGTADAHYSLLDPSGNSATANSDGDGHTAWVDPVSDGRDAQWITPGGGHDAVAYPYWTYTTTFDLTGLDPTTASIIGQWSSDNGGEILLNGVSTGITTVQSAFQNYHLFNLNSGFTAGMNTLTFRVLNAEDRDSPSGLLVDFSSDSAAAPVPEPTTMLLLGTGLVGVAGAVRRRKKNQA